MKCKHKKGGGESLNFVFLYFFHQVFFAIFLLMLKQPFGDQKTLSIQLVVELAWQIAKDKKKKIIQKIIEQENWGVKFNSSDPWRLTFLPPSRSVHRLKFSCGPTVRIVLKGQVYG